MLNLGVADAFDQRRADDERRAALGRPPRHRRRRGTTITELAGMAEARRSRMRSRRHNLPELQEHIRSLFGD